MKHNDVFIQANWPLNNKLVAGTTISKATTAALGFTLARHEAIDDERVLANRRRLCHSIDETIMPLWLTQCHGNKVISAQDYHLGIVADAAYSTSANKMPVVLTADCLPILLSDSAGEVVAAIHAGWQGLAKKIITQTISKMPVKAENLLAWIGPAISQPYYEVDAVFYQRFIEQDWRYAECFIANRAGHYRADLPSIGRWQLTQAGLKAANIYLSHLCSFSDKRFFSYRRDGQQSGRMATFILRRPTTSHFRR